MMRMGRPAQYATGLLRMVSPLFGLPHARVVHPLCGARGDDHCEFEVTWTSGPESVRRAATIGGILAAALTGAGTVLDPMLDPMLIAAGVALGVATAAATGTKATMFARRRIRALEAQVREQRAQTDAPLQSLALSPASCGSRRRWSGSPRARAARSAGRSLRCWWPRSKECAPRPIPGSPCRR
jgi:hypothetical protein